jgi:hypothetical protein
LSSDITITITSEEIELLRQRYLETIDKIVTARSKNDVIALTAEGLEVGRQLRRYGVI